MMIRHNVHGTNVEEGMVDVQNIIGNNIKNYIFLYFLG